MGYKQSPPECQTNHSFRKRFIPTYINLVAREKDPWSIDDSKAISLMEQSYMVVYKRPPPYKITTDCPIFTIVSDLHILTQLIDVHYL